MDQFVEIQEQIFQFEQLLRERDMAVAYLKITEQMGPSPQLLAFVNYSNSVVTDDGVALESMNMFDQHNFIISKLNIDTLNQMAMESLSTSIQKFIGGLYLGADGALLAGASSELTGNILHGITSFAANTKYFKMGGLGLAIMTAGAIVYAAAEAEESIPSVASFTKMTNSVEASIRASSLFAASIPSTLDEKTWESFHSNFVKNKDVSHFLGSLREKYLGKVSASAGVSLVNQKVVIEYLPFDKSGWDVSKMQHAAEWYVNNVDKLFEHNNKIKEKFEVVEKLINNNKGDLGKTPKYISDTLMISSRATSAAEKHLKEAKKLLDKVARHFEEKKK